MHTLTWMSECVRTCTHTHTQIHTRYIKSTKDTSLMYLWWNLHTLCFLTCQVGVIIGFCVPGYTYNISRASLILFVGWFPFKQPCMLHLLLWILPDLNSIFLIYSTPFFKIFFPLSLQWCMWTHKFRSLLLRIQCYQRLQAWSKNIAFACFTCCQELNILYSSQFIYFFFFLKKQTLL